MELQDLLIKIKPETQRSRETDKHLNLPHLGSIRKPRHRQTNKHNIPTAVIKPGEKKNKQQRNSKAS